MGINDFIKIGSRIKAYRIERGYSQREMANKLNLPYSTYSNYENNHREPTSEIINHICDILEIDFPELMGAGEPNLYADKHHYLEEKLEQIGYSIGGDEGDKWLWINYPDGTIEVNDKDLKELDESMVSYLKFKLDELKIKYRGTFRPNPKE